MKHGPTARYYGELARTHGNSIRSVDWGSRRSQTRRFEVLAGVGSLRGASILDVGCGLGDLYPWLRRRTRHFSYTGIDVTPEMIAIASRRLPGVDFRVGSIEDFPHARREAFDFVIASGIFAKLRGRPVQRMQAAVARMYQIARIGVGVNFLSSFAASRDQGEFHADPSATFAFCLTLTPWAVLRHDYHPRDFTVYLYKARRP